MAETQPILTPDDIEFLRNLANELKTQDRELTGKPVFMQVREHKKVFGIDMDYADNIVLLMGEEYTECYTVEQAKKWLLETDVYEKSDLSELKTLKDIHEFCKQEGHFDTTLTGYAETEVFSNCFLTRKGYEQHMNLNRHNYRHPNDLFIHHAWRNPELQRLLEIVEKFAMVNEKEAE